MNRTPICIWDTSCIHTIVITVFKNYSICNRFINHQFRFYKFISYLVIPINVAPPRSGVLRMNIYFPINIIDNRER